VDSRNVLLVEDDAALSDLVAGLLTHAGYNPITIADHAQIGSAVEMWKPGCVILDGEIRTTGESRTWVDAAAIRRTHPTLPVVMFTADAAALAEMRAGRSDRSHAASFAGSVSKPFVIEEFLATIRAAVETPASAAAIAVFPDVGALVADWPETDLFGTIVHELRAPLTVIRGQVQLARRHVADDADRSLRAMDGAVAQVDRMDVLITQLLDHARLASNGLSLDVVELDLAARVAEVLAAQDFGTGPPITFERPAAPVLVHGDPARIAQILENLIGNAQKYSAAESQISVALTTRGAEAQIRVRDQGVGVPADERALMFTPFFRTSVTRSTRGTGLGLHISKRLAERHGGRLWLEESSSSGSTFAFALPLARPDATQQLS
jgi:signal transduction histidine kinase